MQRLITLFYPVLLLLATGSLTCSSRPAAQRDSNTPSRLEQREGAEGIPEGANANTAEGAETLSPVPGLSAKQSKDLHVTLTGKLGPAGDLSCLYGISLRNPGNEDQARKYLFESEMKSRWQNLPKSFIRHPAGSHSYKITSVDDPNVRLVLDKVLPQLPSSITHDFTWPPQLPVDEVAAWTSPRTGRISIGNEPPNHIPRHYAQGQDYIDWAENVYRSNPKLADKFWIQTGKPEVVRFMRAESNASRKHSDCLESASRSVKAGRLPARIITTHKLTPAYPADRLGFYRDMLDDYRKYFGSDVRICFQEFNFRDEEVGSLDQVLHVGEFLLIMARLRSEQGAIVDGAAFHQGFAVGTAHLFGLDARGGQGGTWQQGAVLALWEEFGRIMSKGQYAFSQSMNRPEQVQVEVFTLNNKFYALFSNLSAQDVKTGLNGLELTVIGEDFQARKASFKGVLPARSVGILLLNAQY
jgi:hypothetical protein